MRSKAHKIQKQEARNCLEIFI